MNSSNKLFVFSVILVPTLLILVNHASIYDFYTYSVPLNSFKIIRSEQTLDSLQKVQNKEDSACFTTPSMNYFCHLKPRMYDGHGISYVVGLNEVEGEMHFDLVNAGVSYFTIKNMTKINNDEALVTLADKNYRIGDEKTVHYEITDKFEYSKIIKKFDTFISHCSNYKGTDVSVIQYLGTKTINGTEYFVTWHTNANSKQGIKCNYPQIIKHSFEHNFRDL